MTPELFSALAEPNRLRIVELLRPAPRSVGEIALRLELRQPQVTKHLQLLERAGLVSRHPLGKRRIYALRREALRALEQWAASFGSGLPSERVLEEYAAAIEAEQALARSGRGGTARAFDFERDLPASVERVWRAWTVAEDVHHWWSPAHFEVVECAVDAVVGGTLRIVLGEPDGSRYVASGRFLALDRPRRLTFEQSPLDDRGRPLFVAVCTVRLRQRATSTRLALRIVVTDARPKAAAALAGIELGWEQLLDKLATHVGEEQTGAPRRDDGVRAK